MGKGNKPQPAAQYNTALTESKEKSPEEVALSKAAVKSLDWYDKGDFTNPHEGGIFVNYADPAILHRNRELQSNAGGQGINALGVADPNYLAAVKENQAAENEQSDAAQYESDIQQGLANATAVAGDTSRMDLSRKMNVLGTTASAYQADLTRPKWWQSVLAAAGAVGQGVATHGV